jgi:hypothetical protein
MSTPANPGMEPGVQTSCEAGWSPGQLSALLTRLGCPESKAAEMAAQLDKRARQLALEPGRNYEAALTHLVGLMRQGWAAKERGL